MATFLIYLLTTGGIDRTGAVPDGSELMQVQPGEGLMIDVSPDVTGETHWVDLGPPPVLVEKDAMSTVLDRTYIAAGLSQVATISGVPQGALFFVDGVNKGRVDDGVVTFSAAAAGSYALALTHYRYLDQGYTVDVGIAQLTAATATEYTVSLRAPLLVASEGEAALAAGQERTSQLTVVSETETAVSAVLSIRANLDVIAETESVIDASAPLPAALETEAVIDATLSNIVQLPEAVETEAALDAAA